MMICGVLFLSQLCQSSLNMGLYFMKYVLGNEALLKTFTLFANAPLIVGLIIIPWLVRKLRGMYKLNIAGYFLAVLGRIGVLVSAYIGSIPAMLVFTGIAALGVSPLQDGMNALIASCSEYTFLTQRKRIDGTMYSCSSFGTAICGWLMAAAGYVENAAVQTASTLNMLHILYLWVPVILNSALMVLLAYLKVEKANEKSTCIESPAIYVLSAILSAQSDAFIRIRYEISFSPPLLTRIRLCTCWEITINGGVTHSRISPPFIHLFSFRVYI